MLNVTDLMEAIESKKRKTDELTQTNLEISNRKANTINRNSDVKPSQAKLR